MRALCFAAAVAALSAAYLLLASAPSYSPDFHNIAASAGLRDVFPNGGTESKQWVVENTGSGVAFIDYDNDGLPDIFVVSVPQIFFSAVRIRTLSSTIT